MWQKYKGRYHLLLGLMIADGEGRYQVNQAEIERLRALSSLRRAA